MMNLSDILGYKVFTLADTPITVGSLIVVAIILLLTVIVSKLIQRALSKALGNETPEQLAARKTTNRLVHYAMLLCGLGIALGTLGINLSALFAAGAVFAVGIGFAVQNILENFFSGLLLMFERSIRPTDIIKVEGEMVKVQDVRVRTTTVVTLDGIQHIVPNSKLAQSIVKNMTGLKPGCRIHAHVGVHYDSDMTKVMEILHELTDNFPERLDHPTPQIFFQKIAGSTVNFDVCIWIQSAWDTPRLHSKLLKSIWDTFNQEGIEMAYPQIDVHFDNQDIERITYANTTQQNEAPRST